MGSHDDRNVAGLERVNPTAAVGYLCRSSMVDVLSRVVADMMAATSDYQGAANASSVLHDEFIFEDASARAEAAKRLRHAMAAVQAGGEDQAAVERWRSKVDAPRAPPGSVRRHPLSWLYREARDAKQRLAPLQCEQEAPLSRPCPGASSFFRFPSGVPGLPTLLTTMKRSLQMTPVKAVLAYAYLRRALTAEPRLAVSAWNYERLLMTAVWTAHASSVDGNLVHAALWLHITGVDLRHCEDTFSDLIGGSAVVGADELRHAELELLMRWEALEGHRGRFLPEEVYVAASMDAAAAAAAALTAAADPVAVERTSAAADAVEETMQEDGVSSSDPEASKSEPPGSLGNADERQDPVSEA
eukprot:TRINITY_DN5254_c0_g1_i2.p1 TRINITY_DN5254_c0_g1~~TRINITY_DN5254_c0_g1_i2.p1  ORF type:complete len:358 (-),score=104.61 TRINITY_DN5254_c0_g1_i2:141-1214(-)